EFQLPNDAEVTKAKVPIPCELRNHCVRHLSFGVLSSFGISHSSFPGGLAAEIINPACEILQSSRESRIQTERQKKSHHEDNCCLSKNRNRSNKPLDKLFGRPTWPPQRLFRHARGDDRRRRRNHDRGQRLDHVVRQITPAEVVKDPPAD